ncbi:SOS response-associated peptidase [Aquamicrobium sp. NLF2-7]|uniref:SOS response-associated peptidase n=1 Tax=Aquamicrobium sp. NLF2-7 TaxID=2918753 RepID=UPI001EFBF2DC|nr:SOS response-associated peptidase [Aquamicrobium sp. NLF2-7]MCG8270985.1 SOS response-associated peptidase [Aquamicrobium sp. NLF2-7]
MCGRFTRYHSWRDIHRMYELTDSEEGRNTEARYNIAPTQEVLFITEGKDGYQKVREGRWWLVPSWAKEMPKYALFNARSEDAAEKPAFRDSFKSKRCLIPADGFYEWTKAEDGGKDPWFIHLPDQQPFSFAGLWAYNPALDITSCTILTAAAQEPMKRLHDRQPIILDPTVYDAWLDPATPVPEAKELLVHDLDGELEFYRVGREVNATRGGTDHAGLIGPLNPQ